MINPDSALERGLALLEFIAQSPNGSPYQELRKTNIPSASLTRLLRTLVERGYLTKDSRGWYQLGLKMFTYGAAAVSRLEPNRVVKPQLDLLAQTTGETAEFCVLDGFDLVFIDRTESKQSIQLFAQIGYRSLGLHYHAPGKVALAYKKPEFFEGYLKERGISSGTEYSIKNKNDLLLQLTKVRKLGYALESREARVDVSRVASPIFNFQNELVGMIGIAGPSYRFPQSSQTRFGKIVQKSAETCSQQLGFNPSK